MPGYSYTTRRRRLRIKNRNPTRRLRVRRVKRAIVARVPRALLNRNRTVGVRYNTFQQKRLRVQKTEFSQIVFDGTGATQADYLTWSLSNMPDTVLYQGLYRQYKIEKIVLTFRYITLEQTDDALFPRLYCRFMYDVAQVTPAIESLEQMANVKVAQFDGDTREFKYTIYPKFVVPAYISGTVGDGSALVYGNKYTQGWVDTDDVAVMHHGFVYLFTGWPANQKISMDTEYTVSFKDPL